MFIFEYVSEILHLNKYLKSRYNLSIPCHFRVDIDIGTKMETK